MADLGAALRSALISHAAAMPQEVTVFLSAGVDSHAMLFALLEAGRRPTVSSFVAEGRLSNDFSQARETARRIGLTFRPVLLPTDRQTILDDVRALVRRFGLRKKAEVECSWPFLRSFSLMGAGSYTGGYGADGHFGVSKKAVLHWKERMPEFRQAYYANAHLRGEKIHSIASAYGASFICPFASDEVRAIFSGETWEAVNKPKQKQPVRDAFGREMRRWGVAFRDHENLQLSGSGIDEAFMGLLALPGFESNRSPVAVYNAVARGEL